jgi:copper chaperone CopZ
MKHLRIAGMTGAYSADTIKNSLEMVSEVDSAYVSHEKNSAEVNFSSLEPSDDSLVNAVKDAGYTAEVIKEERKK